MRVGYRFMLESWYRNDETDDWHLAMARGIDSLADVQSKSDWLKSPHHQIRIQGFEEESAVGEGRVDGGT